MSRGRMASCSAVVLGLGLMSIGSAAVQERKATDTPAELVATYNSLADTILAAKRSEEHLVRSILATTHAHAELAVQRARGAIEAKQADAAGRHLEELATLVGQLGTEGATSIAAVRKRLLEGRNRS